MNHALALALVLLGLPAAASPGEAPRSFDSDVAFLRRHVGVVVLEDPSGARVAAVPAWQGRVMTSTVAGAPTSTQSDGSETPRAPSYGWLNEDLIASGVLRSHMNAFGGEDRLWLGPEGGQFSIFFKKGDPFDFEHWQTPPLIDTEPWSVSERGKDRVSFRREGRLVNHSGTAFEVRLERTVRVLDRATAAAHLGPLARGLRLVGFESRNTLLNAGAAPWTKESGLLSIWILGMFAPSPRTTIVVPYAAGPDSERGPVVNDAYFGKVPKERLLERDGVLYFKGDGRHRSKIGLSPQRARPVLGSYDAAGGVLTLVLYDRPEGASEYVNSMWEVQKRPFTGDVVNSYNDGPPSPGARPMGPFYELETSSPAAALGPGEGLTHVHRTFHLEGDRQALDAVARRMLGVSLQQIETALE